MKDKPTSIFRVLIFTLILSFSTVFFITVIFKPTESYKESKYCNSIYEKYNGTSDNIICDDFTFELYDFIIIFYIAINGIILLPILFYKYKEKEKNSNVVI